MGALLSLIRKEILVEGRSLEGLSLMLSLSLLISAVAALSLSGSFLAPDEIRKVYPALVWIVFVFSATASLGRSFDYELRDRALEGLLLCGAFPWQVYLAKLFVNGVLVFLGQLLSLSLIALLLGVPIGSLWGELLFISAFAVLGYTALATLLAAMSGASRLKNMLLPIILLPLLFPILFSAVELTAQILAANELDLRSGWLSLLAGLDVVYIMLGINLYEHVVRE